MSIIVRGQAPQYLINDDFDGSTVDTARWDVYSNQSVTVANGAVTLNKTNSSSSYMAFLYSKMVYDGVSDYEVEFEVTGMTGSRYEPDFGIFAPEDGLVSSVCGCYLNPSNYTTNNGMRLCINGAFVQVIDQLKPAFLAKFIYKSAEKKLEIHIDDALKYSGTHDFSSYAGTRLCFARVTGSSAKSISIGRITARNLTSSAYEVVNRVVSAIIAGAPDGVNREISAVYRAAGGVVRLVFGGAQKILFADGDGVPLVYRPRMYNTTPTNPVIADTIYFCMQQAGINMMVTETPVDISKDNYLLVDVEQFKQNDRNSFRAGLAIFAAMPASGSNMTAESDIIYDPNYVDSKSVSDGAFPQTVSMDVSDLTGEYYLAIYAGHGHNGGGTGYAYFNNFMLTTEV